MATTSETDKEKQENKEEEKKEKEEEIKKDENKIKENVKEENIKIEKIGEEKEIDSEPEIINSKKDFYVSTTELETEDTDVDIKIPKKKFEKQSNTPPLSISNTTTDLTLSMSQIIAPKEAKKVTFIKRQQNSEMGRSISEILRAKLAELPVREEGNFTLGRGFK
uniref:Uncharacterized protein n=1 Tax=Meloidogyne hapla TaxID=6305 RepID=A0A1I8BZD5_MELHA